MEQLAQFRILEKIGEGGMGAVYRARDEKLQRDVAIKIVSASQFADPASKARLLREARSAAGLSHPNICIVHEAGEDSGMAYIAMERVEGETLSARLDRGALSLPESVRFGIQLADALAHAHQHGIVHRDLKPGNVIITPEKRVKVLDFGLAHRVAGTGADGETTDVMLSAAGAVAGTPAYMAPEQLRGQPADERSDIWALGVMLQEMVTGERPFAGNTWPELSAAILVMTPRPLPESVPPELKGIIGRCLEKEPGSRYQNAVEIRSALEVVQTAVLSLGKLFRATPQRKGWSYAAAAGVVVLAVAFGYLFMRSKADTPATEAATTQMSAAAPSAAQIPVRSMAVLPFASFSGPEGEYLADGMQDAVIGELARIEHLRVLSRTSTAAFRKTDKSATDIARALNAEQLVEGSVQHVGDRVRIQLKLIQTVPQEHEVWSQVFERDLSDIFALYSEIAGAVAAQVDPRLASVAIRTANSGKVDPEVYKLYLKGTYNLKNGTDEGFKSGLEMLRQANAMDPSDPLPYGALAMAYASMAHSPGGTHDMLALGRASAQKALAIDPGQYEAHAALALIKQYGDWDWKGLEDDFRAALARNPSDAELRRHYAWYLMLHQRADEAIREMKRARDTEPLSGIFYSDLASHLLYVGRYEEGIAEARKGLELEPDSGFIRLPLGDIYARQGKFDEAIEIHRRMVKTDPWLTWALGITLAVAGKADEARAIAEEVANSKEPPFGAAFGLAQIYATLGEKEKAFEWMERGREQNMIWMPWLAVVPACTSLRDDPRFIKYLQSLGVPAVPRDFGKPVKTGA